MEMQYSSIDHPARMEAILPISGVESVIGSMSPTIVEKIVIASRIVTPEKWLPGKSSLY